MDADEIKNSGIQYFSTIETSRKKPKIDLKGTNYNLCLSGRYFTSVESARKNHFDNNDFDGKKIALKCNDRCAELKSKLYSNIKTHLNSYAITEGELFCEFNEEMIFVTFHDDDTVRGSVLCILCQKKNVKKAINVYCRNDDARKTFYWIIGNFSKHLKNVHKLQLATRLEINKKNDTEEGKLDSNTSDGAAGTDIDGNFDLISSDAEDDRMESHFNNYESDDVLLEQNLNFTASADDSSGNNEMDIEMNSCSTGVSSDIKGLDSKSGCCINLTIESMDGSMRIESHTGENMANLIYRQISTQITKMLETVLLSNESEEEMPFEIENSAGTVQVANIKSDGNCLFRAIVHQLSYEKLNTKEHDSSTKKLRAGVVAYIKEHYGQFEHEIKGCVLERKNQNDIDDIDKECKIYLRYILPKSGCWGGAESIKAISSEYEVNVLIINEYGPIYFANGFNTDYLKTIIIAYRLGNKSVRNHYDSVIRMEQGEIFACSQMIAEKITNQQTCNMQNDTISLGDSTFISNLEY